MTRRAFGETQQADDIVPARRSVHRRPPQPAILTDCPSDISAVHVPSCTVWILSNSEAERHSLELNREAPSGQFTTSTFLRTNPRASGVGSNMSIIRS